MEYENRLQNVAVLGAAGKMGSGILLLTAVEMANLKLKPENKDKTFSLHAVDVSNKALEGLIAYVRKQVTKIAEKSIVDLRKAYEGNEMLIENSDIIDQYVDDVVAVIRPTTRMESAYDALLVFEAVNENPDLKVKLLSLIDENNPNEPWYFTNTSSVPIHSLDERTNLNGRIIGFHFYNPPAVQKLVELIPSENTRKEVQDFALKYAKALKKIVVPSNDIAGFIGNGHFMRDALFGIQEVERLSEHKSFVGSVYTINKVTQDFLVRPMGIFQLIDYVGIDVVRYILQVMNPHFDENLHSPLLDKLYDMGVKGGQNSDGSQKDGFLKYEKGKAVAAFDPEKKEYVSFDSVAGEEDRKLGDLPASWMPWKKAVRSKSKDKDFKTYFNHLKRANTTGSELALRYGRKSRDIAKQLVSQGVAHNDEDVNTVLMTGFFHAYGPINEYFE
ncbi:MAG TPA: 3-hydroxyacyl-CoA dehydrogenase family protein [Bacteroidales bacterium]|nr:3-hydroxyacyl-CoA dehydrogenase family protein [Bacteroidales bacterium]